MSELLDLLLQAEQELPDLLQEAEDTWRSTDVVYHPPRVERVQRNWRDSYRLSLHRIHPCATDEALLHNHPWPQASKILPGYRYKMGIGAGPSSPTPPVAVTSILYGPSAYAMDHPDAWHYVQPLERPILSVMLTASPWGRPVNYTAPKQPELSPENKRKLLEDFRAHYHSH